MRKLFILLALLSAFVSKAAFMSFTATNSIGNPDTNSFILTAISTPLAADGSFTTTGLRIRVFPNASGVVITNLAQNNWNASNQFFNFCFRVPLDTGPTIYPMGQNLLTAVAPGGIGPFVTLVITNAGTNGNISYNQITNGLGYVPLSNSILPALTNGFVGAGITNGLAGLDTVYNASNVIEGGLNLALTNVLPTNGAGVYSIGRNGWISTNYDPFGLALTIGANDTNNVTVTSNALQSQITQGGVTGTVLTNTVNASSNLLSTLFITNAFGTNWPIVIVTGQRIYIPTNFDTAGAALAIGAADTNFANFISNIVAQLSITNVYGTNTTLSVAGQRVYVNTNFDLLGAAASIGTANSNYTFSTSNSVMVNAQALTNQLATTNWVGKLFIPNINGFGTNLTLSDFASSAPDLLIAPNGGANGLYISNELVDLGINLSTGPEASVLFSESPWPTVASLGSNYLRLLYVGGNGGGSPFGTPGSTVGVLSNAWATNITGPGLVLVTNIAASQAISSTGITNAYRTNWPFDGVINQSLYYPTNWDTNGTANLQGITAMQSATNFGLSKFVQMQAGDATNLFSTGQSASNLTAWNSQLTNTTVTNAPFWSGTNIGIATYPVIYQSTNLVVFITSGTSALTNAMYIWIPSVGCYSNANNQGTITNNGVLNLCQDNTGSTLFNNSGLTGSWTRVNGTGAAVSDYGAYLRGDGINIVGIVTTNSTILSGPSNGIAMLNGFGTNTTLTNATLYWNRSASANTVSGSGAALNFQNAAMGEASSITGSGGGSAILSGASNSITTSDSAVISGGLRNNLIFSSPGNNWTFLGGGVSNTINGSQQSAIVGGEGNSVDTDSERAFIAGGRGNYITLGGVESSILGGVNNTIESGGSIILGGQNNFMNQSATGSLMAGIGAKNSNNICFIWSDGNGSVYSTSNAQVIFHATNGFAINTNNAGTNALEVFGNVDSAVGFTIKGVPVQTAGNFILQQNGNSTNQTAISAQVLQSTNFALAIGGGTNFYASTNVVWVYAAGSPNIALGAYRWNQSFNCFTNKSNLAIITNTGSAFNLQTNSVTLYSSATIINASWGAVSGVGTASTRYGGIFLHDGMSDDGSYFASSVIGSVSGLSTGVTNSAGSPAVFQTDIANSTNDTSAIAVRVAENPNEYLTSVSLTPPSIIEGGFGPSGSFIDCETNILNAINVANTNGFAAAGFNWYLISDIWATNIGGQVVANPNTFPDGLAYIANFAHTNGFKIMLYVGLGATTSAGNAGYNGNYLRAAADCASNNVDGVFIEGEAGSLATSENFVRALAATGKRFWVHTPTTYATNFPNWFPWLNNFVNSWYASPLGAPDPTSPNNYTNFFSHLAAATSASGTTRPGHWLYNFSDISGNGESLTRAELESMAALSSVVNYFSGVAGLTYSMDMRYLTNQNMLALDRDPLVRSANLRNYRVDNSLTNMVFAKSLWPEGGSNCLVWAAWQNTNSSDEPMTITTTNLSLPPVCTLYSPWSGAIENWASNVITLHSVGGFTGGWTNASTPGSLLYKVMAGFQTPNFISGTNYLSDQPIRMNATNAPTRDMRANGQTLQINSTTYAKGFCGDGLGLNDTWEIPIGGVASRFMSDFGKQQAWDGGNSAVQLTIWTNGTQAWQSFWVTNNSSQATNINLDLTGVLYMRFYVATNGNTAEYCLGNCMVTVPTPGSFKGSFSGSTFISYRTNTYNVTNEIVLTNGFGMWLSNDGTFTNFYITVDSNGVPVNKHVSLIP